MRTPDQKARLKKLARVAQHVHRNEENVLRQLHQSGRQLRDEREALTEWLDEGVSDRLSLGDFGVRRMSKLNTQLNSLDDEIQAQSQLVRASEGRLKHVQDRVVKDDRMTATKEAEDSIVELVGLMSARRKST